MKQLLIIFLISLVASIVATSVMYPTELKDMGSIIGNVLSGVDPSAPAKIVSLELDTSNAKLEFAYAEEFSTEGLKITAVMSNGTKEEIPASKCKIVTPDTTEPGNKVITVRYKKVEASYEVLVKIKEIPPISDTPLVSLNEINKTYRVEAESINMDISGVKKATGVNAFIASADAATTSGGKYITGYNVKWNYFGFTFSAAQEYKNSTIVLRVSNSNAADLDAGAMKMFLNFKQDENGKESGLYALNGYILETGGAGNWSEIVIRNVDIPKGANTLTFEVQGDKAFNIDYIDFYTSMPYVKSLVELNSVTTVVKDLETLDTEKAFTRSDVANAHGLKPGQLFVEPVKQESPGKTTSGGMSVGAIGTGSQISTTLYVPQNATVRIRFKASRIGKGDYYVADHWSFNIDGIDLVGVERININGGDASKGMYWDWIYTTISTVNLPAGYHSLVITINGTDCNVDTVEFEVLTLGSYHGDGVGLDEMHECTKPCPNCGKCTNTECTFKNCVENKCGGHDGSVTITGTGEYKAEAEDLDISKLTPSAGQTAAGIETPTSSTPPTSGGKSIGMAGGGYVTFKIKLDKKATVQIYGSLAYANGGAASDFLSAAIGDTALAISGSIPVGTDSNRYWNWAECPFGSAMNLEAGEYVITVNFLKNPNVDYFKVVVYSYGEFTNVSAPACTNLCSSCDLCIDQFCTFESHANKCKGHEHATDIVLTTSGTSRYELENINCANCDINTRSDFVPVVGAGNCGKGSGRIYGYSDGSIFRVYVRVTQKATIKISLAGFGGTALNAQSYKFGDTVITPADGAKLGSGTTVAEGVVGTVTAEAGIYCFEFTSGDGTDLDYIAFEIVG